MLLARIPELKAIDWSIQFLDLLHVSISFLPSVHVSIDSPLSIDEAREVLELNTSRRQPSIREMVRYDRKPFVGLVEEDRVRHDRKPFVGLVEEDRVRLHRSIGYQAIAIPEITGRLMKIETGTRLTLTLTMIPLPLVILPILTGIIWVTTESWWFVGFSIFFLGILSAANFLSEVKVAKQTLIELLNARLA